jgi:hypothetical protein
MSEPLHSMYEIPCPFSLAEVVYPENSSRSEGLCDISQQVNFFWWRVVSPTLNRQAWEPPVFSCPRLLIEYIRSYPLYLDGVSSIRNLRTRHAVVTRDTPNMEP